MPTKPIDLRQSVYVLCTQYPELPSILASIGFQDMLKPGMLQSVGRVMTLPKGAALKKLDMGMIQHCLTEHGFSIIQEEGQA